jgi:hypothetical protein
MKPRIGVDQISHSIALHLDEPPARSVSSQINNAWKEWGKIENKNPKKILLRGYDSIPTLQGHIVKDQYALIELLTFHTPPDDRAAILATKKDTPALFNLFSSKFEKLWLESSK